MNCTWLINKMSSETDLWSVDHVKIKLIDTRVQKVCQMEDSLTKKG